jgi:hypothetical protein
VGGALWFVVIVVALVAVVAGAGKGGSNGSAKTATAGAKPALGRHGGAMPLGLLHVSVRQTGVLPRPIQDAAAAALPADGFLLIGGLDQSEASHQEVLSGAVNGARTVGRLPTALHDACATSLGGAAYVFGGGQLTSFAGITRVGANGIAQAAGSLPTAASDVGCATVDETAYVVGGYTGVEPLRTILAWRPGTAIRVVARLPQPLRYAAVAVLGRQIVIVGGTDGERASEEIYRFDPHGGSLTTVGRLPSPLTHAAAAAIDGTVLVFGGRSATSTGQRRQILAISPTGQVRVVGALPEPLSDMAAVTLGGHVVLAGGRDANGRLHDSILSVTLS